MHSSFNRKTSLTECMIFRVKNYRSFVNFCRGVFFLCLTNWHFPVRHTALYFQYTFSTAVKHKSLRLTCARMMLSMRTTISRNGQLLKKYLSFYILIDNNMIIIPTSISIMLVAQLKCFFRLKRTCYSLPTVSISCMSHTVWRLLLALGTILCSSSFCLLSVL